MEKLSCPEKIMCVIYGMTVDNSTYLLVGHEKRIRYVETALSDVRTHYTSSGSFNFLDGSGHTLKDVGRG